MQKKTSLTALLQRNIRMGIDGNEPMGSPERELGTLRYGVWQRSSYKRARSKSTVICTCNLWPPTEPTLGVACQEVLTGEIFYNDKASRSSSTFFMSLNYDFKSRIHLHSTNHPTSTRWLLRHFTQTSFSRHCQLQDIPFQPTHN